ncbi:MAG: hypothetical protein Ta2F_17900 [Termitinemataceae bacterium]|nr:MAG: hypothetical protein Ta2F_17900 [Termitinemataceae bacterium]
MGEAADLANGVISLARGDVVGAGLSFVSMVPVVGDGIGKGGKVARAVAKEIKQIDNFSGTIPMQLHHFATNKSYKWTGQMYAIAKKFGLDLKDGWNKALMPHQGRHPDKYHQFVLDGMKRAEKESGGDADKFKQLYEKYVKDPILNNPELLRKSGWE